MILDNKEARGYAARFRIVSCSRKGRFPPQGRGAHSFLEKNPPHTPEEKHQGVSTSPWTPNDTKAGGLGPAFGNQPPEAGAAARKHRHGNTIPNPDGPPIVPFPRKRAALSAPGGALVLSPLEPPPGDEGRGRKNQPPRGRRTRDEDKTGNELRVRSEAERTGVEIRRFGFPPRCAPHSQMRGYADLIFGYSAAGRRLPDFVGSA